MKRLSLLVAVVVASLALLALRSLLPAPSPNFVVIDPPRPLPDIAIADGEGKFGSPADFRGKYVLLNIWATWCVPCRKEMPTLDRLEAKLGGPDFEVVALSIDRGGADIVRRFYQEIGVRSLAVSLDAKGEAPFKLGAVGVPTTLLIEREGRESAPCRLGRVGRAQDARLPESDDRAKPEPSVLHCKQGAGSMTSLQASESRASRARRLLLLVLGAVFGLTSPAAPAAAGPPQNFVLRQEPAAPPEIRFADGDGKPGSLADFRGKVVLLNIWATWCLPCRKEMPTLDRLQAQLGGPDFEVVGVSIDRKGAEAVRKFFADIGVTHISVRVDPSGESSFALGAFGLPVTLLIDRQGRELGRLQGPAAWDASDTVEFLKSIIARKESRAIRWQSKEPT